MHILTTYPTPQQLSLVTFEGFFEFCRSHNCGRSDWVKNWYSRLIHPQPEASLAVTMAYQAEIQFLAQMTLQLMRQKQTAIGKAQTLFKAHPDHEIFASLPGAGALLQPKLLAMFGEDRDRFPSPQEIRALAGTCPVTKQSGKSKRIQYLRACNHDYRNTVHQFAISSLNKCGWALAYYSNTLTRSHRKNHAYRWLGIMANEPAIR